MEIHKEFYKYLEDSLKDDLVEENVCLITSMPLDEFSIKLTCGHSFNYKALYNELISQRFRFNNFHNNTKKQLKCPYCRDVINDLLPYYPELELDLVYGVNSNDLQYKKIMNYGVCVYANTVEYHNGKCCYNYPETIIMCHATYVILHKETNKTYCSSHIGIMRKNYNKQLIKAKRHQINLEKKEIKLLQKLLQQKEKAIKKKTSIKKALHKLENDDENENVIISLNQDIPLEIELDYSKCIGILKYGVNKGKQCGCKIFQDHVCKKHCSKEPKEKEKEKEKEIK